MRHLSRLLAIAITILATPVVLDAQTCMGLAPFSAGRVRLGAGVDFGNDAKAYTGSLAFGSTGGAFGGVSVGTVDYDDGDESTTAVGAQLGWQVPHGTENRLELCPSGSAEFGFGPDNVEGSGTDVSTWSAVFGLQLGFSTEANPQFRIVPSVGAALAYSKLEFEGGFLDGFEEDDTYGIFTLGVGFVVNTRVSILPSVAIPAGLEGADPVYRIMAGVNF